MARIQIRTIGTNDRFLITAKINPKLIIIIY
jgi:hypothetical protein